MNIKSVPEDLDELSESILKKINEADKIVIGAGSGLSSSAGLDYNSEILFAEEYMPFLKAGYQTITDGISQNWQLTNDHARKYWGFWSHHINYIFYSQKRLLTYDLLFDIIKDKNCFIITSNADGQFFKGDFNGEKVFAMQGSYGNFQCQHACNNKVYDNRKMISNMLKGFNKDTLEILEKDIPRCQDCGGLLSPNLRIDQYFVQGNNLENKDDYVNFVNIDKEKVVFLELGVGFNTPSIIRYPFEDMTYDLDDATLIRVNDKLFSAPDEIIDKTIIADMDIHKLLVSVSAAKNRKG